MKKNMRQIPVDGHLAEYLTDRSPSTRAPASKAKSPEELSFERVTVKPEVVVVLPQTYTPRGATLHTA